MLIKMWASIVRRTQIKICSSVRHYDLFPHSAVLSGYTRLTQFRGNTELLYNTVMEFEYKIHHQQLQLHSTVFHRKCLRSILIHSFRKANNISSACINRKMASHNNSICCNIPIFFIHSILPVPSSYLYGGSHRSPENFSHAPLLQRWIVVGILPKSPCASNQQSYIIFSFLLLLFNITKSTHTATHPFAIAQPERYSVVFVCVCVICAMHEFRLARLCRAHSSRNFAL